MHSDDGGRREGSAYAPTMLTRAINGAGRRSRVPASRVDDATRRKDENRIFFCKNLP